MEFGKNGKENKDLRENSDDFGIELKKLQKDTLQGGTEKAEDVGGNIEIKLETLEDKQKNIIENSEVKQDIVNDIQDIQSEILVENSSKYDKSKNTFSGIDDSEKNNSLSAEMFKIQSEMGRDTANKGVEDDISKAKNRYGNGVIGKAFDYIQKLT